MTKDLITDVNIYLTMSCREYIHFFFTHGIRGISVDQQTDKQATGIHYKKITVNLFFL